MIDNLLLKHDIQTLDRLIRIYPTRTIENVRANLVARLKEDKINPIFLKRLMKEEARKKEVENAN